RLVVMEMATKAGWPEWRINPLAREVSFGIQSDRIEAQNAIHKCLDIEEIRSCDLTVIESKTDVFPQVHELAAELQRVVTESPGHGLKELVGMVRPAVRAGGRREGRIV